MRFLNRSLNRYSRFGSVLFKLRASLLPCGALLILLFSSSSLWSQSTPPSNPSIDSMPAWTVLALKLVSATHVQPTTGIVIAAPNLVVVPIDFAREGDEIMVLDGGTDIVRHGRPATIIHTLPADELAILKVQGLNRPSARLTALAEAELKALNLVAFPPAEMIAQGAAPVRSIVKALPAITTTHPTLDPFPNVSGALTDSCGNLAAFNLAVDVQSMQPAASPRVVWPDALKRAAELAGGRLRSEPCSPTEVKAASETIETEEPAPAEAPAADKPEPDAESAGEQPAETATPEAEVSAENEPTETADIEQQAEQELAEEEQSAVADGSLDFEPADSQTDSLANEPTGVTPAEDSNDVPARRFSIPALLFSLLALALLLGWWIYRKWAGGKAPIAIDVNSPQDGVSAETVSAEPNTVRFDNTQHDPGVIQLQLEGQLPDGTSLKQLLPIKGTDWQVEIGREDADMELASATVSRRHARIQVHDGQITVSDLGSTNGTRVNGVPCLPGEIFMVQPGDSLQLGDVTLNLQLIAGDD